MFIFGFLLEGIISHFRVRCPDVSHGFIPKNAVLRPRLPTNAIVPNWHMPPTSPFQIAYPNANTRPYRPPPPARFNKPSFSYRPPGRPSPPISAPPKPPPPHPLARKPPSPVKSNNVQDRLGRLSVHERLGPQTGASGLEKARRRLEAAVRPPCIFWGK